MYNDYRGRRRGLLVRARWAVLSRLDAIIEARAERRSELHYVRVVGRV